MFDSDFIDKFIRFFFVFFFIVISVITIIGIIGFITTIFLSFDEDHQKKVKQESLYIAKCKSMEGIHVITNDMKYCYKDGKLVEIE